MEKKYLRIFLILLILNLIPHVYIALRPDESLLNWYLTDDAFYYFKVAQNISEGRGITFDGLAPTNGFHPLWMLVCVPVFALARFDLYLPLRVLIVVQAVLNAASGYFLYRLFADNLSEKVGWVMAFLWMFLPAIHGITTKLGLESGLTVFTLLFLIYQVSRLAHVDEPDKASSRDLFLLGLSAVLVLFSRLDNIFVLVILGCWLVFRHNSIRWISQVDFVLILLSALLSYYSRIQTTDNIFNFLPFAYMLIGFSMVIKPVCLYFLGLYGFNGKITLKRYMLKTAVALTIASLLIAGIFYVLHDILHAFRGISRAVLILDWLLTILLIGFYRLILFKNNHCEHGPDVNNLKKQFAGWIGNTAAYFIPLFGILGVYMFANKHYAGSSMPVSGQIKRWWGTLPNTVYGRPITTLSGVVDALLGTDIETGPFWLLLRPLSSISDLIHHTLALPSNPSVNSFLLLIVWVVFISIVLVLLTRYWNVFQETARKFALLPLAVGCLFHAISYKATGYMHAKYWYWLAEMILIMLMWGILLALLLKDLEGQPKKAWMTKWSSIVVCVGIWANFGNALLTEFPLGKDATVLYDYETDFAFLEEHTEPDSVIGMTGGGLNAYFMTDRIFVNLDGLINSADYFESLQNDQGNAYLESIGLDYVYGEELILLDSDPYRWVFTDHLSYIGSSSFFNLYRYCQGGCQ